MPKISRDTYHRAILAAGWHRTANGRYAALVGCPDYDTARNKDGSRVAVEGRRDRPPPDSVIGELLARLDYYRGCARRGELAVLDGYETQGSPDHP